MTIRECYAELGDDINEAIDRLVKEDRVERFFRKLVTDEEFTKLKGFVSSGDWREAFFTVHGLKGTCLNLGLSGISEACSALCEELREGAPRHDITGILEDIDKEYDRIEVLVSKLN